MHALAIAAFLRLAVGEAPPARECHPEPARPLDLKPLALPERDAPTRSACEHTVASDKAWKGATLLAVVGRGEITLAVWQRCKGKTCTLHLGRLRAGLETVLEAKVALPLPLKPGGPESTEVYEIALADLDADGAEEVIVRYGVAGPERKVIGALSDESIGVWNLPLLTPAWHAEVARFAGADHEVRCEYRLGTRDIDCDGHPDLALEQTCGQDYCFPDAQGEADPDCKRPPQKATRYFQWAKDDRYRPAVDRRDDLQ